MRASNIRVTTTMGAPLGSPFTSPFDTIADIMAAPPGLSTGLPQLDRVAPLTPGRLAVLMGASATGKTRIVSHVAETINATREHGALVVTTPTPLDELAAIVQLRAPALLVVDPLLSLLDEPPPVTDPDQLADQHPVSPPHLQRLGMRLRELAHQYAIPVIACHRFTPQRDSVNGKILSTDAISPLIDVADFVAFVRVQADPRHLGLEIVHNDLEVVDDDYGPTRCLQLPLPTLLG